MPFFAKVLFQISLNDLAGLSYIGILYALFLKNMSI